jgi:hypothetical protein
MAKISDMSLDERETHLSLTASNREIWEVFSDDLVMMAKFERLGIEFYREEQGGGRYYRIPANQVTVRKKREMSDEQREELSRRARANFGR